MIPPLAALITWLAVAAPALDWRAGPPRAVRTGTPAAVGEDGHLGALVDGRTLVTWDVDSGRTKKVARLPAERWRRIALAPKTDGENERALVVAERRLALVHLRTGRLIGDWPMPAYPRVEWRDVAWSVDGRHAALFNWELAGIAPGSGVPVLWVDAETGTVVSQLRLNERAEHRGMAALADRSLALGTPKRVIVLGPGPDDARTIGIEHDGVVGATRDGIVVLKKGAVVVIDARSGSTAKELTRVRGPVDVTDAAMVPGGRWAVAAVRDGVVALDLATKKVHVLAASALGGGRVLPLESGLVAVGGKTVRLDLTVAPPEEALLASLCARGDCKSGEGVWLDLAGGRQYTGAFKGGKPHGQGSLRYADGAIYTGPFVRGEPHGAGKVLSADGDEKKVIAVEGELRPAP